jgi:hypothetical protein
MAILIIGEKPSVGRAISTVVGADKPHKGYIESSDYIVSWCVGHLPTLPLNRSKSQKKIYKNGEKQVIIY